MSSESALPPPSHDEESVIASEPSTVLAKDDVRFSRLPWAVSGVKRALYRFWTRIAVRLFPEDSRSEVLARSLHIPLPDKLNMSWVTPSLAVGGRVRVEDIPHLKRAGVTHVIDTRAEHKDDELALAREGILLLYLPTPDTYPLTVEQLTQGSAWAQEQIAAGGRVLIHCEHGVGRSVLLTCATLVYDGMSASAALVLVQKMRWQAFPNSRQIQRLREFACSRKAWNKA